MSKAIKEPPSFTLAGLTFWMSPRGHLCIDDKDVPVLSCTESRAFALADWIYATFGEENEQAD